MKRTETMIVAESKQDELALIIAKARDELEGRGYDLDDVGTSLLSAGVNAMIDAHGPRKLSRELYMLAMSLAQQADAQEKEARH